MSRTKKFLLCALLAGCGTPADSATDNSTGQDPGEDSGSTAASSVAPTGGTDDDASESGAQTDSSDDGDSTGMTPLNGCGTDPGISGAVMGEVEVSGMARRFTLVLPPDYDFNRAYPFVFMFHGRGSDGAQFRQYNGVEEAAAGEAIFVYPDALPNAQQSGQTGWDLSGAGIDIALMDRLLADFDANLCLDPDRIFATGHSHGGFFSNTMGCLRGDVIRAIAPVAGGGPGMGCQEGTVAAWLAHNPDDNVVPYALGVISRNHWTERNGCTEETIASEPGPCVTYQGCEEGYEVVWCEHMEAPQGIGPHTWPTFAGAAIWAFFAAH